VVLPLAEAGRGVDGDLALDLLGLVVGDGIALVDLGQAAGGPRVEQEGRRQGRLAGRALADQGDVSDLLGGNEGAFNPKPGFSSSAAAFLPLFVSLCPIISLVIRPPGPYLPLWIGKFILRGGRNT
jgi:hypothetical protein